MMITSVEQFVKAIGGNSVAASAFDASKSAVSNWTACGRFPTWAFPRAQEIARGNDLIVDPKLFSASPIRRNRDKSDEPSKVTRTAIKRRTKNHHAA
jgi:hypothetical protein